MSLAGKAELKPIYEAAVRSATYVTLTRKRQFVAIQPSTLTRVGPVLPGVEVKGRLQESDRVGGGRVTHCIALTKVGDFNAEVNKWLKAAYEQDP